jgi:short-subunit dehydrogenase
MAALRPVTLITGASSGIGTALTHVFAAHRHELVLVARREAELNALADQVAKRRRPRPLVLAIDLTRTDAYARISAELSARGLEPGIVVNNAGFGLAGQAAQLDRGEQIAMIDLNIRALTDLSLRFTDSLTRHKGGILNVASVAGFLPGPGMAVYYATKAYVLSFSEALAKELEPAGVKVSALCPGPVPTEFQARAGIGDAAGPKFLIRTAEQVAQAGYAGFMRGERIIIPGWPMQLIAWLPRFLPRGFLLNMIARSMRKRAKRAEPRWPRPVRSAETTERRTRP